MKKYFELIGAVPAEKSVAGDVFKVGHSLMIFPGGNRQAFRPLWKYKENSFPWAHGWADIAFTNKVTVVPVTYKGSHFTNPILLSGTWISKCLILPAILGIKWATVSLGQIVCALFCFYLLRSLETPILMNAVITYIVFIVSPLVPVLPFQVEMKINPPIMPDSVHSQDELEKKVEVIMNGIYPGPSE